MKFTLSGFQSTWAVFERFLFQCSISDSHSSDYKEQQREAPASSKGTQNQWEQEEN
jgi:hypothetical protein